PAARGSAGAAAVARQPAPAGGAAGRYIGAAATRRANQPAARFLRHSAPDHERRARLDGAVGGRTGTGAAHARRLSRVRRTPGPPPGCAGTPLRFRHVTGHGQRRLAGTDRAQRDLSAPPVLTSATRPTSAAAASRKPPGGTARRSSHPSR